MPLDKTICVDGVVVDQTSLARSRIQGWPELASLTPAGSETPADRLEGEGRSKGLIWNPREESRILGWAFLGSGPLPAAGEDGDAGWGRD
ncbi:uncharacterized protein BO88DRAFT_477680 [Aspergillus vadensis CBS 113365]|uniref:Uncharacterized protein n=1 Tax=Aspergillus vadensis (strain CBS 113365 / IMI 142717 / IBT 24658) TaxID=1448311 RepID=A0A319AUN2_ASPVC|nr:hypothetical protein BO88DRAFT_477680 [Aspergillus vadensis CBS 113365]PYH63314.1 hypothetical protein BO88DRAFT_477680 [Aspergillus vadensis CBS 113365]